MAQKTLKVSPFVHQQVMELARRLDTTASGALLHLMNDTSVAVPLEPVQRERWEAAAALCGVSLAQFVLLRIEASLHYRGPAPEVPRSHPSPVVLDTSGDPLPVTVWGACCTPPFEVPHP